MLVVQNTETNQVRRLGDWWRADGLTLDVVPAYTGRALPERLTHDALVILGGGFMPDDDHQAPWLPRTRDLARQALQTDTPVLGVCLGGQLLAHVGGGTVRADAGAPERGSTAIRIRPEADTDPLFHSLPAHVTAIENHVDAVEELPRQAVWLASSQACPYQAFRIGDSAWGVQFHPEVSADDLARWDRSRMRARGVDVDALVPQARADEPAAARVWRQVASRFAEQVRSTTPRTRLSAPAAGHGDS